MHAPWFVGILLAPALIGSAAPAPAAEKDNVFQSGLHPGDRLASFKCRGVTGPERGKSLCYV